MKNNPIPPYPLGRKAKDLINEARAHVAAAVGASKASIYFTGSGTESDNQAILGVSIPIPIFDRNQGNLLEALRRTDPADRAGDLVLGALAD